MIVKSYQSEISRHISLFHYIPGFTPYRFNTKQNIWIVSKSIKKKNHYKLSHFSALISTSLMVIRLLTKSYDIFLTNLGGALTAGAIVCLLTRWNSNCNSKYVNSLNKLIVFEKRLIVKIRIKPKGDNRFFLTYNIFELDVEILSLLIN